MNYTEAFVQREQYRIYVREYAGDEPVVIQAQTQGGGPFPVARDYPALTPSSYLRTSPFSSPSGLRLNVQD